MDRVFLDANVLFSAAYAADSRLLELWSLTDTELVTSEFALEEARRNLVTHNPAGVPVLDALSAKMAIVASVSVGPALPDGVDLADKDMPILTAASEAGCTHLLTGDRRHFGQLYGREFSGVLVLTPAQYLRE